jgi:hypothetical protein
MDRQQHRWVVVAQERVDVAVEALHHAPLVEHLQRGGQPRTAIRPARPNRLRGNADEVQVDVLQHHMITFKPPSATYMPPGRGRPTPTAELPDEMAPSAP